jgi:tetratricopeptide (TPR) repeat protein
LISALRSVLSCPGYSAALELQAAEWIDAGQAESAEDLVRAWAEAVPEEALAWSLLGRSVATRNPAQAIPALERSVALDPAAGQRLLPLLAAAQASEDQAAGVAEVGRVYLQQEEWALAAVALKRAVVLAPEQARTRAYLGLAQERNGGDGLPEITAALAMRPNDPSILILHASLLRARGRLDEAVTEALTAAQLEPGDPAIAAELGAAYADQGDLTSATSAYKQAARLTSDRPEFWLLLARFSADNAVDEQGLGLPAARNAVALQEGDANAWQTLGQLHFQLGNQILADRMLRRALTLAPRLPESWYDFGLIRLAVDDRSGAQEALHAVLALDPGGPWADLAQRALTGAALP